MKSSTNSSISEIAASNVETISASLDPSTTNLVAEADVAPHTLAVADSSAAIIVFLIPSAIAFSYGVPSNTSMSWSFDILTRKSTLLAA